MHEASYLWEGLCGIVKLNKNKKIKIFNAYVYYLTGKYLAMINVKLELLNKIS